MVPFVKKVTSEFLTLPSNSEELSTYSYLLVEVILFMSKKSWLFFYKNERTFYFQDLHRGKYGSLDFGCVCMSLSDVYEYNSCFYASVNSIWLPFQLIYFI